MHVYQPVLIAYLLFVHSYVTSVEFPDRMLAFDNWQRDDDAEEAGHRLPNVLPNVDSFQVQFHAC